jgi:cobalt-zinc-cadmium efflux system membrane fusion protein
MNPSTFAVLTPRAQWQRKALVAGLIACSLILGACGKKSADTATATAEAAKDPMLVQINEDMIKRLQVGPVADVPLRTILNVPGRIEVDEQRLSRIGSNVTGRVVEVLVSVGDQVGAGRVLAKISSPELTNAQLSYLRAASSATLAERASDRATQLFAADVIGKAELQRRQAEAQVAKAEVNAAADQLRMLGMSAAWIERLKTAGDIQPVLPVMATQAGVVIERKVTVGQVVQPADLMFAVADLSSLWVVGGVAEQAARDVAVQQKVDVQVPALSETLKGRIVFVSDTVSPETRTVTVRTELPNPDKVLKPAMLANLQITSSTVQALAVPATAVVRENDKDYVFLRLSPTQFKLHEVGLGAPVGDFRPVLSGVQKDQTIVLDGAFHLNNERKRAELN